MHVLFSALSFMKGSGIHLVAATCVIGLREGENKKALKLLASQSFDWLPAVAKVNKHTSSAWDEMKVKNTGCELEALEGLNVGEFVRLQRCLNCSWKLENKGNLHASWKESKSFSPGASVRLSQFIFLKKTTGKMRSWSRLPTLVLFEHCGVSWFLIMMRGCALFFLYLF